MLITTPPPSAALRAADALADAERSKTPCPPVRGLFAPGDIDAAYAAQRINTQRALASGRRLVGRKIGLTSPAAQAQLGVEQPDFGALFDDVTVPGNGEVPAGRLLQPKVEAEVALVLGRDLTHSACTAQDFLDAVDAALPALEIVDSRITGWDITITDTIADNASSGLFVLGHSPKRPDGLNLARVRMTMTRNGEVVSTGTGADCLGSPLNAGAWLASALARRGDPLRANDVVLTGALGPMTPARPGDAFHAEISGLGTVGVRFAPTPDGAPA
ncbi:2-keto-4-pentenoate hydratase [Streptomyces sp. NPDC004393]